MSILADAIGFAHLTSHAQLILCHTPACATCVANCEAATRDTCLEVSLDADLFDDCRTALDYHFDCGAPNQDCDALCLGDNSCAAETDRLYNSQQTASDMRDCRESHLECMTGDDVRCENCLSDCRQVSRWGFAATMMQQCECYTLEKRCRDQGYTDSALNTCEDCIEACDDARATASMRSLSENDVGGKSSECKSRCDAIIKVWSGAGGGG